MQTGKHNGHQEHVASYYAATRNDQQQWPELEGEHKADVCIIGGGFTGLNTAINLADAGYKVCCWRPTASAGGHRAATAVS